MKDRNVLRDLIREGKPTIGTHLFTQWPGMVEIVGHSGTMDYIEFSGQYAPYDLFSLENFGRAIDMFDHLTAMMKLDQEPRTYLAERAVGSGIQNLLFAEIRDLDDAKEAIAAIKPHGPQVRGPGGRGQHAGHRLRGRGTHAGRVRPAPSRGGAGAHDREEDRR